MTPFDRLHSSAVPLLQINIDTDCIIPSREMKRVSKKGLGEGLFAGWRYLKPGVREANPDFILNDKRYKNARILLTGNNFGCGSSREHAVWALMEYGFRAIIAPSFGAIFYNNCINNGLLPVVLTEEDIARLAEWTGQDPEKHRLVIDLDRQQVIGPGGRAFYFDIAAQDKDMLLRGFDMIDLTLERLDGIVAFEQRDEQQRPWAGLDIT